jgi:hypothetical protein
MAHLERRYAMLIAKTKAAVAWAALLMLTHIPLNANPPTQLWNNDARPTTTTQLWNNDSNSDWKIRVRWMPDNKAVRSRGNITVTRMMAKDKSFIPDGKIPPESCGETAGNNTINWPAHTVIKVNFENPTNGDFFNQIMLMGPDGDLGEYTVSTYFGFKVEIDEQTWPDACYHEDPSNPNNSGMLIAKTYITGKIREASAKLSERMQTFPDHGLVDDAKAREAVITSAKGAKGSVYLPDPTPGDFELLGLDVTKDPTYAEVCKAWTDKSVDYFIRGIFGENFKNLAIAHDIIREYYYKTKHK